VADGFLFGGIRQTSFLLTLGMIVFLLPNTQEWVGYVAPNDRPKPAGELTLFGRLAAALPHWRPTLVQGSVLGVILGYCLLSIFAETPSEFLYFQF
jgi:hypothetical protein